MEDGEEFQEENVIRNDRIPVSNAAHVELCGCFTRSNGYIMTA